MADQKCSCQVCEIARKGIDYKPFATIHSNSRGATSEKEIPSPAKVLPLCSKCFSEIGRGKEHVCLTSTRRENLATIIRKTSQKTKETVTSKTLKTIAVEEGVSTRGGTLKLQTGSKPIPIQIGTPRVKPREARFSHANLMKIQAGNNLSDNTLL